MVSSDSLNKKIRPQSEPDFELITFLNKAMSFAFLVFHYSTAKGF